MNNIRLLLKYIAPYKWQAIKNIIFNILSAFFALFTYTLVGPFLNILFKNLSKISDPGEFRFNLDYLGAFVKYHILFVCR